MSKKKQIHKNNSRAAMTTQMLVFSSLFAAISIVLARLLGIPIMTDVRISMEAIPILLCGYFYGPLVGGLVGFVADFIGSILTFGFNPVLCLPPIMIGIGTGLFRDFLSKKYSLLRWFVVQIPLFLLAYVIWQGFALTMVYGGESAFWQNYAVRLGWRSLQFSLTMIADVVLIDVLFKAKVFRFIKQKPVTPQERRRRTRTLGIIAAGLLLVVQAMILYASLSFGEMPVPVIRSFTGSQVVADVLGMLGYFAPGIVGAVLLVLVLARKGEKRMNLEQTLEYIHSNYWNGGTFGLGRVTRLLDLMGHPEKDLKFIHIAGTNGKGSTASMSANILRKAGYNVGLYTSPYIFRFHERMQVNGECISDEEVIEITGWIKSLADTMESQPSEFELVTCIAFEYFKRHKCDIISLEVGLGGEFDATNTIGSPEVAVLTNIGLDHTELLGDTLEKIAETKSKIIKPGTHAVTYREPESVEAVFEARCKEVGADWTRADFDTICLHKASLEGQVFSWGPYQELQLPLLGQHQLKNAAVVLTIVDVLRQKGWNISEEAVREGLATVSWPGRFELVAREPLFIVDGGHNPQCIEALVANVRDYLDGRNLIILTGVLADKDYNEMYADMSQFASEFVTVTPGNPRAMSAHALKEYLTRFGKPITACDTVAEGVALAKEKAGKDGVVLAYGSLYMVGEIEDAARA